MSFPADEGFRMPAEWAPHTRCWMAWPVREETWVDRRIDPARDAYVEVARAIAEFEPVTMVCPPEDAAEVSLRFRGDDVEVLPMPLNDSWMRDIGPTFLIDGAGGLAGVDWDFNAWGRNYDNFELDRQVARRVLDNLKVRRYEAPFILEGGSIHVDGEGTLLTTEQCLLNPNRNPGMAKAEIEENLKRFTGARQVIWLGEGLENDETDGHIDEVACFVRPGVALIQTTDDPSDHNYKVQQDNLARLRAARDAQGRELEIVEIPQPARREANGERLCLSYVNFYLPNGGVVMPAFETPQDEEAFRIMKRLFPDRRVVQLPAMDVFLGGGGIHCITQQQPAP